MKLIKYMGMTLVAYTFASCTSDDGVLSAWESDPEAVRIQAMVGNGLLSRSNPIGSNEEQQKFVNGDQLNLQTDGQGPYTYTFTNGVWTPKDNNYLTWKTETMNVSAYTALKNATLTSFILPQDQSDVQKIATADYMTFTGTCIKPVDSKNISLELQRQTVRIDVVVSNVSSPDNQKVSELTIAGNSVIKEGKYSELVAFAPYVKKGEENTTYTALVAPNDLEQKSEKFLSLKVNGTPLTVTSIPVAVKGKMYTYHLDISGKSVALTEISVLDWTTGGTFDGGEIGSKPVKVDADNHTIVTKKEGQLTPELIMKATDSEGRLNVTGPLNANDIKTLGQQTAQQTQPAITSLDLSKAKITSIPANAFQNSKNLTSLTLPATVTSIGDGFISGCNKLTSLTIMSSMTTLKDINPTAFTGFTNAGNCDLKLDSSRNDQIDADATKVFAKLTWKSITDLNGSEFTGTESGTIGGEVPDIPIVD